jgi:hypothetical protein
MKETLTEITSILRTEISRMSENEKSFWETISLSSPEEWICKEYDEQEILFWVVALFENNCIYYNHIEEGFNLSRFSQTGVIEEYWCNQDELNLVVISLLNKSDW